MEPALQSADAADRFFRAETVGSLLRPDDLIEARRQFAAGAIGTDELRRVEDRAIADVVRLQEDVGLALVTDGEYRRENWWIDFVSKLRNVVIRPGRSAAFTRAAGEDAAEPDYVPKEVLTVGKLATDGPILVSDYTFLASQTRYAAKVTLPSPTRMHFHGGRGVVSTTAYPDIEDFYADAAAIYRAEIAALERAGCRYIQIDDPVLAYFLSPRMREGVQAEGDDPDARLARYIQLINDCIAERSPQTRIAIHICRGNARSGSLSEGSYEGLAETCFGGLAADRFLLEYDDPRSGGFEPLRFIPAGKEVVLGLVTTKHPALESRAELRRRIDEAARYVPLERLAISPQCGFASVVEGNRITVADEIAKLSLVVELAREIWGES